MWILATKYWDLLPGTQTWQLTIQHFHQSIFINPWFSQWTVNIWIFHCWLGLAYVLRRIENYCRNHQGFTDPWLILLGCKFPQLWSGYNTMLSFRARSGRTPRSTWKPILRKPEGGMENGDGNHGMGFYLHIVCMHTLWNACMYNNDD